MSVITDVALLSWDRRAADSINEWSRKHDPRGQQLEPVDTSMSGGHKVFSMHIWAMGGNYFPWYELVADIEATKVKLVPDSVLHFDPEMSGHVVVFQPREGPVQVIGSDR